VTEIKRDRLVGVSATRRPSFLRCECWDCITFRRQLVRRALRWVLGAATLAMLARHALPPKVLTALWPFASSPTAPWL